MRWNCLLVGCCGLLTVLAPAASGQSLEELRQSLPAASSESLDRLQQGISDRTEPAPELERLAPAEPSGQPGPQPETVNPNRVSNQPTEAATRLRSVSATAEGFFIRTVGTMPEVQVSRSDGEMTLEFSDAAISFGLGTEQLPVDRYSVSAWQLVQTAAEPPTLRMTLTLAEGSPDWQVSTRIDGVTLVPRDVAIGDVPDVGAALLEPVAVPPPAGQLTPSPSMGFSVPNGQVTVVIDPGHGGRDPGAVGIGGLQEKQVVNDISYQVADNLRQAGVNVVLTRDSDYELELEDRVQIAERANANLFVSIHANAISLSRPDVNGLETYYASSLGQRLAQAIHSTVLQTMGMRDRGVRQARFYVIRNTSMPATLVETGFVTGAEDQPNLRDPAWRSRMAAAIAQGILLYIQQRGA
ncbi:N-acetylmuramoyl-L-alanine amidase family protein [Vasconcelosia minhoensis]|nr:N-acetylmuramoyl-L-alanine amidase [Romeria gracilis]